MVRCGSLKQKANMKTIIITENDVKTLKGLKNYFGENDKTSFEHLAYSEINSLLKRLDKKRSGVELIAEERKRQIEIEGWKPEHDSEHKQGELALAASCYATPEQYRDYFNPRKPNLWLWEEEWWKPSPYNRIKELQKAGALIAAEIDRLSFERES